MRITSFILAMMLLWGRSSLAQDDGYKQEQDLTIAYFEELDKKLTALGSGGSATLEPLNDKHIHYLTGIYLYCSIKNGACPLPLQAMLELDLASARLAKNNECPNLLSFWRAWMAADFERRWEYDANTGYLAKIMEFKSKTRPRFVKCKETVKTELAFDNSDEAFFKSRYAEGAQGIIRVRNFIKYMQTIKERVPDVFVATGAYDEKGAEKSGSTPKQVKKLKK